MISLSEKSDSDYCQYPEMHPYKSGIRLGGREGTCTLKALSRRFLRPVWLLISSLDHIAVILELN